MLTNKFISKYTFLLVIFLTNKSFKFQNDLNGFAGTNPNSFFRGVNLAPALKLIDSWQQKMSSNDPESISTKEYIQKVLYEHKRCRNTGTSYIPTFPPLILNTILNSNVFIYTDLLPKIPFTPMSNRVLKLPITLQEDSLIALGLEQFTPFLEAENTSSQKKGKLTIKNICQLVQKYLLPGREVKHIYSHVLDMKRLNNTSNPIKYYYENGKVMPTVHYLMYLEELKVLPPCQRPKEFLPYQWRKHLYPDEVCTYFYLLCWY